MIEIRDLKTEYSSGEPFTVREAVFPQGKISTIIGRNGSGKTTLLKVIAGQKRYSGSVLIDGKECRDYSAMERARKTAFLPQGVRALSLDVQTLAEHGRYPHHGNFRRMTEKDREHVRHALQVTRMDGLKGREIRELSGGERQRAYLAMVIAQDTPMILMDEPTTYMDRRYQDEFFKILRQLTDEGKGIVMVSHDLEQTFAVSDRIYVMEDKGLLAGGTPEELLRKEDVLRRNFGAALKAADDEELMYPYVLKK